MKNLLIRMLVLVAIISVTGCERDEICLEEISPKLIIRFYDDKNPSLPKQVINLKVHIEGIEGEYTNETIKTLTDSIALPILVTQNSTRFTLTLLGNEQQGTEDNPDHFELIYTMEDEFVSRSCGYRTLYYGANGTLEEDGDNWIKSLVTANSPQDITNETRAHVKIFH